MQTTYPILEDLIYVGASDRRLSLFENIHPIDEGMSYNSYVMLDEKTALLDTCDKTVRLEFLENVKAALNGRALDYLIVNHMEPDHCATIEDILRLYPKVQIVCNPKSLQMIKQFYDFNVEEKVLLVKEGEELSLGKHTLMFIMAPMVHWPEVMMTYDKTDKILFSADAFGSFGALSGNLFADEIDFNSKQVDEFRRYYTNIVGKYGSSVQNLCKKIKEIDIKMVCPLHGVVFKSHIDFIFEKYQTWSTYCPEEKSVAIFYGSIYGNTENAATVLAVKLAQKGVRNIALYDVSKTHPSYCLAEAFKKSHLVLACSTYNGAIFTPMETLLLDMKLHNLQKRTVALIENGTWGPMSGRKMKSILEEMKEITVLEPQITIKSAGKKDTYDALETLAGEIAQDVLKKE
ncbi:MAG: FprA family A-type flavoprotein [Alphaproteobacteria bacterium]|nr:FprA family A-type flavoprotein [Alphaproteobacteria bacterium]